jgi:hypothetical protein
MQKSVETLPRTMHEYISFALQSNACRSLSSSAQLLEYLQHILLLFLFIWNLPVQESEHNCKLKVQKHILIANVDWYKQCRKSVNDDDSYCQHTLKAWWAFTEISMRNSCFVCKTTWVFKLTERKKLCTKVTTYNRSVSSHQLYYVTHLTYLQLMSKIGRITLNFTFNLNSFTTYTTIHVSSSLILHQAKIITWRLFQSTTYFHGRFQSRETTLLVHKKFVHIHFNLYTYHTLPAVLHSTLPVQDSWPQINKWTHHHQYKCDTFTITDYSERVYPPSFTHF